MMTIERRLDRMEFTIGDVETWKRHPYQRDLNVNKRVVALSKMLAGNSGVLPGVIVLGTLEGCIYVVDGQHRIEAWRRSGLTTGMADILWREFFDWSSLAEAFIQVNSQLVPRKTDDVLRAQEAGSLGLRSIRSHCPFIGYASVRRHSGATTLVSMNVFLRAWFGARMDAPRGNFSVPEVVSHLTESESRHAWQFAGLCFDAWGGDEEFYRLWGGLNLMICAWLYRRMVLGESTTGVRRKYVLISAEQFQQGLHGLAASGGYLEFLRGRTASTISRGPAYSRVREIFQKRIETNGLQFRLPSPRWWSGGGAA